MQFIVTGTFKYTAKSFANGVVTEREETGSISEIVTASSGEAAQKIADQIFSNYDRKYGEVFCRRVIACEPAVSAETIPAIVAEEADHEVAPVARAEEVRLVCRKCGVAGFAGRGYPFSTMPASSCICDDCGA